jgi:LysM repeat protein
MKKASLIIFSIAMVFLLVGYSAVSYSQEQTQEQTQTQAETPAEPEQPTERAQTEKTEPTGQLPTPLEAEMVVAEHWTRNNAYPRTIAAGSRVHVVEKGDTLWDLAARYLGNPLLWPQIWDQNKYIPNAHWIYPGDPIVITPMAPVSEEQIAKEAQEPPTEEPAPGPAMIAPEKPTYPIAVDVDLYCSGYITPELKILPMRIIGNEENKLKIALATNDVVYLNQGEAEGISPGDEFTIVHRVREVHHPITYKELGDYVTQMGRIKVVATQEHTSTAQITYACDRTLVDDVLIPFEPREVPVFIEMPPVDRYSTEGPNAKGYIVFAKDDLTSLGMGHEVQIDLGAKDGIAMGTRLILYRHHKSDYEQLGFEQDLPRKVLGEMIVYNVQDNTATGRIIQSYHYAEVGDQVEVR